MDYSGGTPAVHAKVLQARRGTRRVLAGALTLLIASNEALLCGTLPPSLTAESLFALPLLCAAVGTGTVSTPAPRREQGGARSEERGARRGREQGGRGGLQTFDLSTCSMISMRREFSIGNTPSAWVGHGPGTRTHPSAQRWFGGGTHSESQPPRRAAPRRSAQQLRGRLGSMG